MHVEDVAVYDQTFTPHTLRENIANASRTVKENLTQISAISAICNAAVISADTTEKEAVEKQIIGDATGNYDADRLFISL